jgi:DNA adenine methylase
MFNNFFPRPFLKWAGGKTQLVEELTRRLPQKFGNYYEPFVGSGALFFKLYRSGKICRAFLSDLNAELVDTYLAIRDHVEEVIKHLSHYPHTKDFYYSLRDKDPAKMTRQSRVARMIYLNKTGYNGLYRVNKQGKFNVPFGRYKSPRYCDKENLRAVSEALKGVRIFCSSFEKVLGRAKAGDLVYFDPPYVPLSATANFTAYHANGFATADQQTLRDVCAELTRRKVHVMLSNSDTELIRELYASPKFVISKVWANRAINCNGERRSKITELIITNYRVALKSTVKSVA